jgi:hypothetical protein
MQPKQQKELEPLPSADEIDPESVDNEVLKKALDKVRERLAPDIHARHSSHSSHASHSTAMW